MSRLRPPVEWIVSAAADLRIVTDAQWDAVKAQQAKQAARLDPDGGNSQKARQPSYLLSGLVRCGLCGGGAGMVSTSRIGCSRARHKGTCPNQLTIARERLEAFVLAGLGERLLKPEHVALYWEEVKRFDRERQDGSAEAIRDRKRELRDVTKRIGNWVNAIGKGIRSETVQEKLAHDEATKTRLEAEIDELEATPAIPALHPRLAEGYRRMVTRLLETLDANPEAHDAREAIRSMIDHVDLVPVSDVGRKRSTVRPVLSGSLASMLSAGSRAIGEPADGIALGEQVTMVAGRGFEPLTFRL
ncbi:hypothetical protein FJU11_18165 [Pararhizobium mangrovi]|uniref:Recombinase zinc beta ribbon domain-containing protein n=1 Tax=Pararhizobium mangrovi TaxID=2590452 RepID=A0A506TZH9_9HYPH|nr:hypothetical protein FJU11_18165 [Pararhizobium mangrovi]